MTRRLTFALSSLLIALLLTSAASAAVPSKAYTFADLVFDSEVKRPSGQHFDGKGKARFGRLSVITPPSFMGALYESAGSAALGSSCDGPRPAPSAHTSSVFFSFGLGGSPMGWAKNMVRKHRKQREEATSDMARLAQ